MASVRPHGKKIAVRLYCGREYSTTISSKPTQANLKAAEKEVRESEARLRAGTPWEVIKAELRGECAPTQPRTLGHYMQHVLDTREVEETTLKLYENTYARIWQIFDDRDITSILRSELEMRLKEFDYTAKSKRTALSVLRHAFEAARNDNLAGLQGTLPTDNWSFRREQRRAKQPYTPAERDKLLAQLKSNVVKSGSIEETAWRYFTLAFFTGLRTEELLAIQRHHLKKSKIQIAQVRTNGQIEPRTKTHREREVYVPKKVWSDVIAPWQFREWLFTGEKGSPFTTQNRLMEQFQLAHTQTGIERPMDRTGDRPMPYPWRNTYVSIALNEGVRLQLVADQIGDDMKTVLDHYAEFMPKEDDSDELERAFSG